MTNKSDEILSLKEEIAEVSKRAFNRGLISGTGGNISARINDTNEVIVTPTAVSLLDVEPESLITVDLEGEIIDSPFGLKPSKETTFHIAAYQFRPEINAVAHLHPPYATAYSNKARPLPLVTISSRVVLKEVPWIECAPPGSSELHEYVKEGLKKHKEVKAFLMKEHGVLALGGDLKTALYITDLVEATAKIAFIESNIKEKT
jgi:L-fuculose-phosphate aldolase